MHGGDQQTSLWEQSDLLDLVGPAAVPAAAESAAPAGLEVSPAATPIRLDAPTQDEGADTVPPPSLQDPCCEMPPPPQQRDHQPEDLPPDPRSGAAASLEAADRGQDLLTSGVHGGGATGAASLPGLDDGAALPPCPERLLILDTETTALSPQQGQCIEVGAVLFDVASRSVLMQVSFLLPCEHNPAQHVNGIPAVVSRLEQPWRSGLTCFEAMVAGADAVLAHNAAFDRQWFGIGDLPVLAKPWICSMEDIRWPPERQLRPTPSVRDLALAYGVPVWAAHRALTDCIYLVQVFQRCNELESLLQVALEPRRLVRARLSYDERQLAKDAGFRWNEPVPKAWSRRLSEREIAALPFAVDPVEADQPGRQERQPSPLWRRSA